MLLFDDNTFGLLHKGAQYEGLCETGFTNDTIKRILVFMSILAPAGGSFQYIDGKVIFTLGSEIMKSSVPVKKDWSPVLVSKKWGINYDHSTVTEDKLRTVYAEMRKHKGLPEEDWPFGASVSEDLTFEESLDDGFESSTAEETFESSSSGSSSSSTSTTGTVTWDKKVRASSNYKGGVVTKEMQNKEAQWQAAQEMRAAVVKGTPNKRRVIPDKLDQLDSIVVPDTTDNIDMWHKCQKLIEAKLNLKAPKGGLDEVTIKALYDNAESVVGILNKYSNSITEVRTDAERAQMKAQTIELRKKSKAELTAEKAKNIQAIKVAVGQGDMLNYSRLTKRNATIDNWLRELSKPMDSANAGKPNSNCVPYLALLLMSCRRFSKKFGISISDSFKAFSAISHRVAHMQFETGSEKMIELFSMSDFPLKVGAKNLVTSTVFKEITSHRFKVNDGQNTDPCYWTIPRIAKMSGVLPGTVFCATYAILQGTGDKVVPAVVEVTEFEQTGCAFSKATITPTIGPNLLHFLLKGRKTVCLIPEDDLSLQDLIKHISEKKFKKASTDWSGFDLL